MSGCHPRIEAHRRLQALNRPSGVILENGDDAAQVKRTEMFRLGLQHLVAEAGCLSLVAATQGIERAAKDFLDRFHGAHGSDCPPDDHGRAQPSLQSAFVIQLVGA